MNRWGFLRERRERRDRLAPIGRQQSRNARDSRDPNMLRPVGQLADECNRANTNAKLPL